MGAYSSDLLFVHIPKCAGTSIREWLKEYVPGTTDFRDEGCNLPIGHIPLRDIERYTGRPPDSFKKIIAIVRNPYAHQLSQWLFWRDRRAHGGAHLHDRVAGMHPTLTDFLHDARSDFHIWFETQHGSSDASVNLRRSASMTARYPFHGGYFRYWLDVDGEVPDNVVLIRMEELDNVWLPTVAEFAVDDAPGLSRINAGPKPNMELQKVLEDYTPLALEIVNAKFQWTFETNLYQMLHAQEPHSHMGFGS